MKTFQQFITEVYDKDVMGRSQIRHTGEGGRIGAERKKSEPEKRRMKAAGGGKMVPAKTYKDRKDIGSQRQRSTREQQPTQARGSAADAQKAAAQAERKKAAQARIAARKSGKAVPEKKPTPTASQLLSKKTTKPANPNYKPQKASGKTEAERKALTKKGEKALRDMRLKNLGKKSERELKNPITAKEIARRKKEG